MIEAEAKRQGVDPDLVKAVMYVENARGHQFGGERLAQMVDEDDSVMPMNINPELWKDLRIDRESARDPETNIRAAMVHVNSTGFSLH